MVALELEDLRVEYTTQIMKDMNEKNYKDLKELNYNSPGLITKEIIYHV